MIQHQMLERYDIYLMERYGELLKEVENYFPVKKKNYGLMLNVDWVQPLKHLTRFL